jgi:hypothetical protein
LQTFTFVSQFVVWALLIILAAAVFALYRHFGQMYLSSPAGRADQGPEMGTALLSISASDTAGRPVILPAPRPEVLLFADTACNLCSEVRDHLGTLDPYADKLQVTVFCAGLERDVAAWASRTPDYVHVVWDDRMRAAQHYRVSTLPFAVAVGLAGDVRAKSIINGDDGLIWAAEHALDITAVREESTEVARA